MVYFFIAQGSTEQAGADIPTNDFSSPRVPTRKDIDWRVLRYEKMYYSAV